MKKWIIGIVIIIAAIFGGVYFFGNDIFEKETAFDVTEQVIDTVDEQVADTTVELIDELEAITCDSISEIKNDTLE